ncbi:MAG: Pyruvoyl-dependent arginine decarboxylase [Candidatus Magnetoglobus multicellularis str. Araruama]|uniref:Pyruvoyl-dependent arginine decarboxylase AaxB n=1 Tax=Candidatus Magnetoglobus multicellularis str. Araruama TaxID=890399 RepID=A0A1V1NYL7_9BACT|nr:MAG: Pyruvoyl-dependent arginine decarboxylase [Candidatus Magnetoglobus multicellularis str. Araruama]
MKIIITTGTGTGPTSLGAFDEALLGAGVGNYNLIPLSSVIPEGSELERGTFLAPPDEYGYRLYVVMAHCEESVPGKEAWAGLGWVREKNRQKGLFVEFSGKSRAQVEEKIENTLCGMTRSRGKEYTSVQSEITGITCEREPVCALVVAVYKSEGWD